MFNGDGHNPCEVNQKYATHFLNVFFIDCVAAGKL